MKTTTTAPRPETLREYVRRVTGRSDLEVTDLYNAMHGTRLASPLPQRRLEQQYGAWQGAEED